MRVTIKGQVTIPRNIRQHLGISHHSEVDFVIEGERVYIRKMPQPEPGSRVLETLAGTATKQLSTDDILQLTRDNE